MHVVVCKVTRDHILFIFGHLPVTRMSLNVDYASKLSQAQVSSETQAGPCFGRRRCDDQPNAIEVAAAGLSLNMIDWFSRILHRSHDTELYIYHGSHSMNKCPSLHMQEQD